MRRLEESVNEWAGENRSERRGESSVNSVLPAVKEQTHRATGREVHACLLPDASSSSLGLKGHDNSKRICGRIEHPLPANACSRPPLSSTIADRDEPARKQEILPTWRRPKRNHQESIWSHDTMRTTFTPRMLRHCPTGLDGDELHCTAARSSKTWLRKYEILNPGT